MNFVRGIAVLLLATLAGPANAFVKGASTPPILTAPNTFVFNLTYNAAALGASPQYRAAFVTAAGLMSNAVADTATINVTVGYNTLEGGGFLPPNDCVVGQHVAGTLDWSTVIRPALVAHMTTPDGIAYAVASPSGSTIGGVSSFSVVRPWAKVVGMVSPTDPATDFYAACGSDYEFGQGAFPIIVGAILHELTHGMGRLDGLYAPFSAGAVNGVGSYAPFLGGGTYLSLDTGTTKIAEYDATQDGGCSFNQTGPQGPNDPLDATIHPASTLNTLTSADLKQVTALGFNLK